MAMSQQQYVRLKGTQCPFCGSTEFEGSSVEIEEGGASQEVYCLSCEAAWFDNYRLVGYTVDDEPREGTVEVEPEVEVAYFIVSGRIPGDDEDTTLTLVLPADSDREVAMKAFADVLYEQGNDDRASVILQYEQDVFVNSVVKSLSKPVEL